MDDNPREYVEHLFDKLNKHVMCGVGADVPCFLADEAEEVLIAALKAQREACANILHPHHSMYGAILSAVPEKPTEEEG